MKRLLAPLACLGLAPLGWAFQLRSQTLPYPSTYVSGTATQALIGQFTDDVVADGALLVGGDVQLLYAPRRVVSYSKTTGPFSSMTKVGLSAAPGREGLLASSSTGLTLLRWNNATRQLASTSVLADAEWAGARELQSVSFDDGGPTHLCALSTSGDKILMADWDGDAIVALSVKALDLEGPALALVGLNWNGDELLDVAYDDGQKLRVASCEGDEYWGYANPCVHPHVLRLAHAGRTDDLVWLTRNPFYDEQVLAVVRSDDGAIDGVMVFGTVVGERLTLADFDADGLQDLLVTRSDEHMANVLYQQETGLPFWLTGGSGGENGTSIELAEPYGSCAGTPVVACGDLDGDGDDDVLYAGNSDCAGGAQVYFAKGVDDEDIDSIKFVKPWLHWAELADWTEPGIPLEPGEDGSALLSLWPWGYPSMEPVNAATDLRVTVWTRAAPGDPIEPVRLVDKFVDASLDLVEVVIPRPSGASLPRYIVVDFSFVEREDGVVVRSFPGWTGQIDRTLGLHHAPTFGPETTGGIDRPAPPPSPGGNPPNP